MPVDDLYDELAHQYDSLSPGLAGDIAFYRTLASDARPPVLELGCGTGRVTIAIARDGVSILGLDRAPRMLAIARHKAGAGANPGWLQADMRNFRLDERFGLIIVPYRGFQHLPTEDDRQLALALAFEHLQPGGRLALDLFNHSALQPLALKLSGSGLRRAPGGRMPRLARVASGEMRRLLAGAGFELEAVYGDFDAGPFDESCVNAIWLARRPD
jgi:SAM-dependent methyltransferase